MTGQLTHAEHEAKGRILLAIGILLWVSALVWKWPLTLSFGDEIGYLGQARLLLEGHVRPLADSAGIWIKTPAGRIALYPLTVPVLLAPLLAISPRLVFAAGVAAAVMLAWIASRVLRSWQRSSVWALLLLAHPTVIIVARTAMADLLQATFAVGAWWALRRGRTLATVAMFAATVAAKPTGIPIALALLAGELFTARRSLVARAPGELARLVWAAVGVALGLSLVAASNLLSCGTLSFGYSQLDSAWRAYLGGPSFSPRYFPKTAPAHAAWLVVMPPLLFTGAWTLWRRREIGPLLVVAGTTLMMSCYFFVDRGRSALESLVLAPRLLLPALVFLMIGYADLVAGLAARLPRFGRAAVNPTLVLIAVLNAALLSARHRRWQEPGGQALDAAVRASDRIGTRELALVGAAFKVGLLYPGRVSVFRAGASPAPPLILCGAQSESYRAPTDTFDCTVAGYDDQVEPGGFHLLVRAVR
jgi:hypothetical protein